MVSQNVRGFDPPGNQNIHVQLFGIFCNFQGGVLYPPPAQIGLILRYVRELNRFYNCTKNQLGPQFFWVHFVCFCQVRPVKLKTLTDPDGVRFLIYQ